MSASVRQLRIDLALNLAAAAGIIWAVLWYFTGHSDYLGQSGTACFMYFTTDSNLLAAVSCLVWSGCLMGRMRDPAFRVPHWVRVLRFTALTSVMLTMLMVMFVLVPAAVAVKGSLRPVVFFYEENVFVLHLAAPVMCLVSFLTERGGEQVSRRMVVPAMAPMAVYSVVYAVCAGFTGVWQDFYRLKIGDDPLMVLPVMAGVWLMTCAIAFGLRFLRMHLLKR